MPERQRLSTGGWDNSGTRGAAKPAVIELSLLVCGQSRYRRRMLKGFFMGLLAWVLLPGRATGADKILFAEKFSHGLSNGWENVAFFKAETDYRVVRDGTNFFLRGVAEKTCSALSRKLEVAPPAKFKVSWRWKVDGVNTNSSERDLKKFDHAALVFVAFATFIGPPRTLNYLWGDAEKTGTVLEHPKSGRAQIFVLQSGNAQTNEWIAEERDVAADWKKVFPDKPMPKIVGLGVMTDSDSLGQQMGRAYV